MYSLLALINFLMPKERGSRRIARAVPYGSHQRQTMDVYAPVSGDGPWPVLYFIYGGSWNLGDRRYYEFAGRALAAAGFVVFVTEYRLVPEVEYPVFLDDCAEGFAYAVAHASDYKGDAARVALMGHSAGAYNAIMLLLAQRFLPARELADRVRVLLHFSPNLGSRPRKQSLQALIEPSFH